MTAPILLPRPRSVEWTGERVPLREPTVQTDSSLPPQGYRLSVSPDAVDVYAADEPGAFYARATLDQLSNAALDATLPEGAITDWPDIAIRGVMLDVSRDKVPTMPTLTALVDRLAQLKINHLQLYTEHTFAYTGHEEVWRNASPFTADEILELDRYCAARHIELAANQNCLGHMERWLAHDRYRSLAISPDGWTDARGRRRDPTTLDPSKPASIELVQGLLAELVPLFDSRRVNVGLDEPWELPPERFGDYLEHVRRIHDLPELSAHEVLMWGDIVANHPERVGDLPERVTVCEWGYEATHPFDTRASVLADARRPFWLCPGTSSWNTILGRATNARENCLGAANAAAEYGARGYLVTDWGDNGHLQYLPVSEPGFAYAASASWCRETNGETPPEEFASALDLHVFGDSAGELGGALLELGDAHRLVEPQVSNMSILALPLYYPERLQLGRGAPTEGLRADDLARVRETLSSAGARALRARVTRGDGSVIRDELRLAVALVDLLCRDAIARVRGDGTLSSIGSAYREGLAREVDAIIEAHRELWLARNRAGGLPDSCRRLERLAAAYRGA